MLPVLTVCFLLKSWASVEPLGGIAQPVGALLPILLPILSITLPAFTNSTISLPFNFILILVVFVLARTAALAEGLAIT